jgi:hypothetical protein
MCYTVRSLNVEKAGFDALRSVLERVLNKIQIESFLNTLIKFNSDLESLNLLIIIYSVFNLNISKGLSLMDTRLIVIAAPLLVAASWALFNIGRLAIQQIQRMKF